MYSYTIFSAYSWENREYYVKKLYLEKRVAVRSQWEYNNHIFPHNYIKLIVKEKMMVFINDSLTVVLVGDWNKLYIQPEWVANNIYETAEIEIGVNGQGSDFSVSYKCNNVIISPEQGKVIFSATNTERNSLEKLSLCVNNFLEKAYTTELFAYGLNGKFFDEDASIFAEVLDAMSDTSQILDNGYEIMATKINRTLSKNGKVINMDSNLVNAKLEMSFNEHHSNPEEKPVFSFDLLNDFIKECSEIVKTLGYELEGEE